MNRLRPSPIARFFAPTSNRLTGCVSLVSLAALTVMGATTPPSDKNCLAWTEVEKFAGYFTTSRVGGRHTADGLDTTDDQLEEVAEGTFEMVPEAGNFWKSTDVQGGGYFSQTLSNVRPTYRGGNQRRGSYGKEMLRVGLRIDPARCRWSFEVDADPAHPYEKTDELHSSTVGTRVTTSPSTDFPTAGIDGPLTHDSVGPLSGQKDRIEGDQKVSRYVRHARVWLFPIYRDLELVVKIKGIDGEGASVPYEKWIPAGTPLTTPGSYLKVEARLQAKGGGAVPAGVQVTQFVFTLNGTSHEPGVCLNFPLPSKDAPPEEADLRFATEGGETDAAAQKIQVKPGLAEPAHPAANATVECVDYGAWSDLTVVAELADGRKISGHLQGAPSTLVMKLPQRSVGSHIADEWKKQQGVEGHDDDDSEKLPNGGLGQGDGFTLYEEYRGFFENGRHICGDPKKIDYFVRNYVGSDARPGLELFEDLTGAIVHPKINDEEFDRNKRVMNINHAAGAHHVDQHGVYLLTDPKLDGAKAVFTRSGVRGRPGICDAIYIQPRGASTSVTTSKNIPASDLIFAYDRAIVHELLHSVGVEHHGIGDWRQLGYWLPADDPENKTGKAIFWFGHSYDRQVGQVTIESTGQDLAEQWQNDTAKFRHDMLPLVDAFTKGEIEQRAASHRNDYANTPVQQATIDFDRFCFMFDFYIGAEHGECSGDELCVMRYYFAQLYEKVGSSHEYYYIDRRPSERAGLEVCHSPDGTGVNAPDRKPQARYGRAHATAGDCISWVDFNDADPPARGL